MLVYPFMKLYDNFKRLFLDLEDYNLQYIYTSTYIFTYTNILGLYLNTSKYSVTYRINRVYFSNVSSGLWLAVQVGSLNQQYPVASFSYSEDNL